MVETHSEGEKKPDEEMRISQQRRGTFMYNMTKLCEQIRKTNFRNETKLTNTNNAQETIKNAVHHMVLGTVDWLGPHIFEMR